MKKLLLIFCVSLFFSSALAQRATFIKSLVEIDNSNHIRTIPALDKGWFIFSLDSLKIYKFNSCGNLQWAQQYSFQNFSWRGVDIIATQSGGFAFLIMEYPGFYHAIIVNADADGNVIWCNSFKDAAYTEVPYTLMQDHAGNFFLYGNVSLLANLNVFNSLTKISPSGNVLWNKLYNHGGIWGGAIITKDKGFLLRTGHTLIKTDANGIVQWSYDYYSNMYQYHKPVEVSDGYIFNGYNNNLGGGDTVNFIKIDKNGLLQWGGKKLVNFRGVPQDLRSKYNGNFIFMHDKLTAGKFYSSWTEFDKDLNVVNQGAVGDIDFNSTFYQNDICFLTDSSAIISGSITTNDPGVIPHIGFIKADVNQHFSCDTTLSVSSIIKPLTQNLFVTQTSSRTFTSTAQFLITQTLVDSTFTVCSNFVPLQLNLGNDTAICAGASLTLKYSSNTDFDRFVWSTGETSSEITISQTGKYWLRAINSCRVDSISDTLEVSFNPFPKPAFLVNDTSICNEQPIVLDATVPTATYLWMDGSTDSKYDAFQPGIYSVTIQYLNCFKNFETKIGDCELLTMPNVITPNSDGANNSFIPIEMRGIISGYLNIYNRWGQEIYATSDFINRPWTGNAYTKKCPDGVYYWILNYTNYRYQYKLQKGSVTLFGE